MGRMKTGKMSTARPKTHVEIIEARSGLSRRQIIIKDQKL